MHARILVLFPTALAAVLAGCGQDADRLGLAEPDAPRAGGPGDAQAPWQDESWRSWEANRGSLSSLLGGGSGFPAGPAFRGMSDIGERASPRDLYPSMPREGGDPAKKSLFNWDWLGLKDRPRPNPTPREAGVYVSPLDRQRGRRSSPDFWEKADEFFQKLFGRKKPPQPPEPKPKPEPSSKSPSEP